MSVESRKNGSAARSPAIEQVVSVVRLGLDAATAYDRSDLQARLQGAVDRLTRMDTVVAVAGEFKQGKSSLVNGLIGEQISPVDDDLATSAITVIRYGSERSMLVRRKEDAQTVAEPIAAGELAGWVTEAGNPGNQRQVESVEIKTPNVFLERGVTVVDTPGSGSLASGYGAATLAFLQTADALIFVSDASAEFSLPEIEFLQQARERSPALLIVQTKIDLYPEWRRIVEINQRHLQRIGLDTAIVPASSSLRLAAMRLHDRSLNEESGYPRLLGRLRSEVIDLSQQVSARMAIDDTRAMTDQLIGSYQTEIRVLADPDSAERQVIGLEQAQERLNNLRGQGARWSTVMNDGFQTLTSNVDYQFRSDLRNILRAAEEEIEETDPASGWETLTARVQAEVARAAEMTFKTIDQDATQLRENILILIQDEATEELSSIDADISVEDMWGNRELETSSPGQMVFKGLNAMRGSYMGLIMVGMLGSVVGLVAVTPLLIGAGVLFGGRQYIEERRRDATRRKQQARTIIRQYVDNVQFEVGNRIRETTRDLQREMRDYFSDRLSELTQTYATTLEETQQSLRRSQQERDQRAQELKARVERLAELRRRAIEAEQLL